MKRKYLFLLMAAALVMGFAACSEDDDDKVVSIIDLSTVTADLTLQNGDVVTGKLKETVRILIAEDARVTLRDAVIMSNQINLEHPCAGLTCLGNATIIVEGKDSVSNFFYGYPGIFVPMNKTLTIDGTGTLWAKSKNNDYGEAAGIGSGSTTFYGANPGYGGSCGNIVIKGGDITAEGSGFAAGIGCGANASCGNITITGGTIHATGNNAPGIGSVGYRTCGDITITGGTVIANSKASIIKAQEAHYAAGIGSGCAYCGKIVISGGIVEAKGLYDNDPAIGSGRYGKFESITITSGITSLKATGGNGTTIPPIGKSIEDAGSGDVNIDGKLNPDVSWMGDGMKSLKLTKPDDSNNIWMLERK